MQCCQADQAMEPLATTRTIYIHALHDAHAIHIPRDCDTIHTPHGNARQQQKYPPPSRSRFIDAPRGESPPCLRCSLSRSGGDGRTGGTRPVRLLPFVPFGIRRAHDDGVLARARARGPDRPTRRIVWGPSCLFGTLPRGSRCRRTSRTGGSSPPRRTPCPCRCRGRRTRLRTID